MNRLRNRLILIFALATLAPLAVTAWIFVVGASNAVTRWSSTSDLDQLSKSLEKTGLELYRRACASLKEDAALGRIPARHFSPATREQWPLAEREFFASGEADRFEYGGQGGDQVDYLVRHGDEVWVYSTSLHGVKMEDLKTQYAHARALVADGSSRDLRRGFTYAFLVLRRPSGWSRSAR